nr:MAG TPA: hypothetical protein [Caudoviricetes sp.]
MEESLLIIKYIFIKEFFIINHTPLLKLVCGYFVFNAF